MEHRWTRAETEVLARTLLRAPSVHNIQPWRLEFDGDRLLLRERRDVELPVHDTRGRDRLISCGAALANVELAVRVLGHDPTTSMFPESGEPDIVAAIETTGRSAPSDVDLHRYSAIARRASYRHPFSGRRVTRAEAGDLIAVAAESGTEARLIHDELELSRVAELLEFAAEAYQHDMAYQRELALWTIRDEGPHRYGVGLAGSALPAGTLPWAGLVRPATALPDHRVLQRRLAGETLLVFLTVDDGKYDHLHAGHALQNTWLAAVDDGLAGSVLTQPLHLPEVRSGLAEDLELPGFPQALMRFGYPAGPVPLSPRRAADEVLGNGF
ncbi:Acg family FMN-binding oxidoreductase [Amycolatopsis sp. EV170708-02-1]|uniref:Acg family FMN-binding oxidoreductase n=1 Tax=Amycolatopsis sp. EV170708-02-1 TaxID=2919322 RepID=UPI001F0C5A69|nr:nitroreductase family protein [Amycolatopsis sp. EV170708-02-1]UMP07246.1 nitroreductase family protein [Amycolatopsis sp. EV170708-02-1]